MTQLQTSAWWLAAAAMALLATACQPGSSLAPDSSQPDEATAMTEKRDTPKPTRPAPTRAPASGLQPAEGVSPAVPASFIDSVRTDLAERAQVPGDDIEVLSAQPVTWRDGSMGCPQPGMAYTMALVPGFRVVLRSGGEDYAYHAGSTGRFQLCENPSSDGIAPPDAGGHSNE